MIIKKELPDNSEFVIVKITKIMPHGAYCRLIEYDIDAYLPIAEVSSGWIKNIHEFIKEGQQDVAKVIFVDPSKRAVDVSLKKTAQKDKKAKIDEYNMEKRSENIFNKAIELSDKKNEKEEILKEIGAKAQTYTELVNNIYEGKDPLSDFKYKEFKQNLYDYISKTIKPKSYTVSYNMELISTDSKHGIKKIKELLEKVEGLGAKVLYLGAPHYKLVSTDTSYPKAEERIKEAGKLFEKYEKESSFSINISKAQ